MWDPQAGMESSPQLQPRAQGDPQAQPELRDTCRHTEPREQEGPCTNGTPGTAKASGQEGPQSRGEPWIPGQKGP